MQVYKNINAFYLSFLPAFLNYVECSLNSCFKIFLLISINI